MKQLAWLLLATVLSALALSAPALSAHARGAAWEFSGDELDQEPQGFYFDETGRAPQARWRVIESDGNRVLAQLDRTRKRDRLALAVVRDSKFKDVKLTVRIKAVDGALDQSGGIVWRYRNSENYLVARLSVVDRNVRLYRVVQGNRVKFGEEENLDLKVDTWYLLRVEHGGDRIKVYLGEDVLFVAKDRHFREAGRIGLWTSADSVTHFDDFRATRLDDDD